MILTAPERLLAMFAQTHGLRILPAPLPIHHFTYAMVWHERFDGDPGHAWLRSLLASVAAEHPAFPDDDPDWRELWGRLDSPRRREITKVAGHAI